MSTRAELAAAVNLTDRFTAHTFVTGDTKAGTVFIRLDRIEYPNSFGGIAYWNVVLLLPQDQAEAEAYLQGAIPDLLEALDGHLPITSVEPTRLDLPGIGILPCAFFNGHREAD